MSRSWDSQYDGDTGMSWFGMMAGIESLNWANNGAMGGIIG